MSHGITSHIRSSSNFQSVMSAMHKTSLTSLSSSGVPLYRLSLILPLRLDSATAVIHPVFLIAVQEHCVAVTYFILLKSGRPLVGNLLTKLAFSVVAQGVVSKFYPSSFLTMENSLNIS